MHLSVDAAIAHLDLEGALVTPGVVPGVDAEPVVLTVLVTPTDGLDGVTTESLTSLVLIDTGLVGQEVLVDSEGSSDGTVLLNVSLDVINATEAIAGRGVVLVLAVGAGVIIDAFLGASGSDLLDIIARWEGLAGDVVGALLHGVVVASALGAVVTSSDDTGPGEPRPGGANLATIAAHGLAGKESAAGSGVGDREEFGELSTGGDAHTIVEGLGSSVSPAGAAVGLIADVVDNRLALGPVGTGIEGVGHGVSEDIWAVTRSQLDGPVGVDDSTHEALDFLGGSTVELIVDTGNPGGGGVGVDGFDVSGEVEGLLFLEELEDVSLFAELHVLAALLGVGKVEDLGMVGPVVDTLLKLGELLVELIKLLVNSLTSHLNDGLAKLADVVVLCEEFVDAASIGDGGSESKCERAHILKVCFYYYIATKLTCLYLLNKLKQRLSFLKFMIIN